ncbi:MAG: GHMP kinase [Planctomycetes bacterium]|nr:GHMP kinase [Planctomycetota bacterium]MBI3844717.1 GHMP kinase [Planctomycetota bacterium]
MVTRAPGRLDVMGGIADYSGSRMLELPIREACRVALQRDAERRVRIVSAGHADFEIALDDLDAMDEAAARDFFSRNPERQWAAYAAGAFVVLRCARRTRFAEGARILVDSDVPEGKGVSSSAALEVAVMHAICAAFAIPLELRAMALLCQRVENHVAGAPCGVMDQMSVIFGEPNRLFDLLCRPAEVLGFVDVPRDLAFFGIDSGVRHAVSGSDYGSVRVGAFMGRRMLGCRGYLTEITPAEFERHHASKLPDRILGSDFLERFGETGDTATRVDPSREYAVRVPTAHPIYEHHRVSEFAGLLPSAATHELGELMYRSHASYSACGLGCEATDRLVALARETDGVFGAKITGGGSGGTVAVLARGREPVEAIAARFARETGRMPHVFEGSSPGAAQFGHLVIR